MRKVRLLLCQICEQPAVRWRSNQLVNVRGREVLGLPAASWTISRGLVGAVAHKTCALNAELYVTRLRIAGAGRSA